MLSAYVNSFRIPELRKKLLFTIGVIALVRLTAAIPCPGVDPKALEALFQDLAKGAGGGVMNLLNLFSGGALQKFAVAALGIMPYISASIIMQLMTPVIPALEKLSREGDAGRQKITQYTRYLTVAICIIQGTMFAKAMMSPSALGLQGASPVIAANPLAFIVRTVIFITAGTMFLMWLGEQITERGVGNGASLIISVNILARLPSAVFGMVQLVMGGAGSQSFTIIHLLLLLGVFFGVTAATVALTLAHRKIPIRHASRAGGRGRNAGQTSYMPLRVNYSGVMPVIFGSAILMFPAMLLRAIPYTRIHGWGRFLQPGTNYYMFFYGLAILLFAFFWVANQFNPVKIADDLQRRGGYVPGIRPGKPTAEFLDYTMTRITFAGALYLLSLALFPMLLNQWFRVPFQVSSFFGGTSLLIMVGVMLDTMRQVEAHLLSRHYDGFLQKGRLRSRRG